MTSRPSRRGATRPPLPTICWRSPAAIPSWWRSPPPCPTRPACYRLQNRFPDRVFDVGIAEQHAVAMATGMAMGGLRPVVAIYSTFLTRALDQINLDTALHGCPVIFCLDRAGITGDDGASHHGLLDMVLLSKIPGMTIFAPSSYEELPVMLDTATGDNHRPHRHQVAQDAAPSEYRSTRSDPGLSARRVRQGSDVCLIGIGKMLADRQRSGRPPRTRGSQLLGVGPEGGEAARSGDDRPRLRARTGGHRRGRAARRRDRAGDPRPDGWRRLSQGGDDRSPDRSPASW